MRQHMKSPLLFFLLTVLWASQASALEYSVDAPEDYLFAAPTSQDIILQEESVNVNRSKTAALAAPGFGTPTSYLPNSGEYLTPNLAAGGPLNTPSLNGTITGSTGGGTILLPGAVDAPTSSYPTSDSTVNTTATGFTNVTTDLYYSNGSLGTLKIPAIGLTVKVVQGTDSRALAKGAGHFTSTSIWDGNVSLAGHNRGVTNHFGKIHTLDTGDTITLTTKLGTRTYSVTSVMKVGETDNSMLAATTENCITLFTCVRDERDYRWCVRAVEA